ncbi:MAG: FAD:protein FMN transferase [Planctomycetota bacterium]|jgi:thiamine biosynthesis lipoprotein
MKESFPDLRLARYAMGTRFEIALFGEDRVQLRAAGEAALDEIDFLNDQLDLFKPDSFLSHLNRQAHSRPVRMDSDLFALFEICREVHEASEGAFDITVGPLMQSRGFRDHASGRFRDVAPEDALKQVGSQKILLDRERCTLEYLEPDMAVDLGAVAKGFALDRAAGILREAGVEQALLHGGTSTIMALGAPPGREGWLVAMEDPRGNEVLIGKVRLKNSAMSLSSPRGRIKEQDGRIEGHVMDPRSGSPAETAMLAAAVSSSATLSDAWSTALLVRGRALLAPWVAREEARAGLVCLERGDDLCCEVAGEESVIITLSGDAPDLEENQTDDG